jgi:hypothetical protein
LSVRNAVQAGEEKPRKILLSILRFRNGLFFATAAPRLDREGMRTRIALTVAARGAVGR